MGRPLFPSRITETEKYCQRCDRWLLHEQFHRDSSQSSGLRAHCRECQAAYHKKNRARHLAGYRRRHLKQYYGMSQEEYNRRYIEQKGVCAICKKECEYRRRGGGGHRWLAVDHDHKTGKIRGLLCQKCNMILGLAFDNSDILRQAATYLEYATVT
jgi:hypothetical protein